MKINITGGGAMGGLFAAHLVSTGHAVSIYDIDRKHVEAIRRDGLRVTRHGATTAIPILAATDPATLGPMDIVMIFVKFGQTRNAMEAIGAMIGAETLIVTLQNGIGNLDIIRDAYDNPIVYGLTTLTSELLGPGHIEASFEGAGETYISTADSAKSDRAGAVRSALNDAGIKCTVAPDIDERIWNKLVVNCCLNTMCAITDLPVGRLVDQPEMWSFLDELVAEICAVALCRGVSIERLNASRYLRDVAEQAKNHAPSMLADVRARRRTEIDCLNGALVEFGAQLAVPTPLNRLLTLLIRGIEAGWPEIA